MTKEEFVARQVVAVAALNEALLTSWVDHQLWCEFARTGGDCTCGVAVNLWFSGPTRLVAVGIDMQAIVFEKQ